MLLTQKGSLYTVKNLELSKATTCFEAFAKEVQNPVVSVAKHSIASVVSSARHIFLVYLFVKVEISIVTQSVL